MDKNKQNTNSQWVKHNKLPDNQDGLKRSSRYNNCKMKEETETAKTGFVQRLIELRMAKGVSAREMSLSIGMTANYINSIENGGNLPSLGMFFEICEYLNVSPRDFFAYTETCDYTKEMLKGILEGLDQTKVDALIKLLK